MATPKRSQKTDSLYAAVALRDTLLDSVPIEIRGFNKITITVEDTHDQDVVMTYYGALTAAGTKHSLGTTTLTGGGTRTDEQTLTDAWPFLLVDAQASVQPASGTITVDVTRQH